MSNPTVGEGRLPALARRRRYIVLPKLQMQIVGTQLAGALLFALILVAAVIGPEVVTILSLKEGPEFESASERLLLLHDAFWPIVGLGLLCVVLLSVVVSHRIAGPLYRFGVILRSLSEGHVAPNFRLRKRDFLKDEAGVMNAMLDGIRTHLGCLAEKHAAVSIALHSVITRAEAGTPADLAALAEISLRAGALEEELARFQFEAPANANNHDGPAD